MKKKLIFYRWVTIIFNRKFIVPISNSYVLKYVQLCYFMVKGQGLKPLPTGRAPRWGFDFLDALELKFMQSINPENQDSAFIYS